MDINTLPLFEPIEKMTYVDIGAQGLVYRLSDRWCVKVPIGRFRHRVEALRNEAQINDRLYQGGVSVPEPRGFFTFPRSLFPSSHKVYELKGYSFGFVREFIDGLCYSDLPLDLRDDAKRLHDSEIRKVGGLGVIPRYDYGFDGNNCLYRLRNKLLDQVVLFDFGFWRRA